MTGTPFAGRYGVRRSGGVAYLALEGAGGLASRLTAIARTRGCTGALPFLYRSDCPALTAPNALDKFAAMIVRAANLIRGKFDVPTVLVFVDTVVTAAGYSKSGDDNDAAIAQRIMSVLSGLSQRTGVLAVGIDHFGKVTETGTRGSSAKEGHADAVLALLADRELNGTVTNTRLAVRKLRDGASGLEIPFMPKTVEVGTDPDGDPITRVVIDWAAAPEQAAPKGWPKSLQLLRRILMTLLVDAGQDMQPVPRRADRARLQRRAGARRVPPPVRGRRRPAREGGDAPQSLPTRAQERTGQRLVMLREIDGIQFVWLAKNETGP